MNRHAFQLSRIVSLSLLLSATATANDPAVMSREHVAGWLAKLADPDAAVRDAARSALMGLSADDLPKLRDAAAARPLVPAQIDPLREAVVHVLMHASVRAIPNRGEPFLGVMLDDDDDPADPLSPIGAKVADVIPGLPAARFLAPGDVIVGIDYTFQGQTQPVWLTRGKDLIYVVRRCPLGQPVTLFVRRAGAWLTLKIVPEPQPRPATPDVIDDTVILANVLADAEQNATARFDRDFGSLPGIKP